ncbi:MAG: flagellar hook-associated protein FlgK [Rhodobacteraceae bacterium]|nr:flagellar hook-associated protein FlgK [Paracoccaceae bacterium]
MGLQAALNTAVFGISHNERQINVTAQNIANADTAGYTRKEISANVLFDGRGGVSGILSTDVRRSVDQAIQLAYQDSLSTTNYAAQIADFTSRVDGILGSLNDGSGLSALMSDYSSALAELVNDPSSFAAQKNAVATAETLARQLNASYDNISQMRLDADALLQAQAQDVSELINNIQEIDRDILEAYSISEQPVDLLDQRDRYIEQLKGYIDVDVSKESSGTLRITTFDGYQLLANNQASTISYAPSAFLQPGESGNGIQVRSPAGVMSDLAATSHSGSIVALTEIRDEILVEALAQLDTIAAELSLGMSNINVASTAATVGLESGFDLDVSAIQSGNKISLTYVDGAGETQNVTLIGVQDPALLPLDNSQTARPDDTVFGFDISSGNPATYITEIATALAATGLTVANDGSDNLRILGDTGASISVTSLTASVTPTADTDQGLGISVFVDSRAGKEIFTDALENGGQRVGYARSITVNDSLLVDAALLVTYETTPTTNSNNDSSRAEYLYHALTNEPRAYDPGVGIGSEISPYQGSLLDYVNQVISYQGEQASDAASYSEAKETRTTNLAIRYEESYSVNVDEELAFLVELQNAYSANARVMSAINDLFDEILNVL